MRLSDYEWLVTVKHTQRGVLVLVVVCKGLNAHVLKRLQSRFCNHVVVDKPRRTCSWDQLMPPVFLFCLDLAL